MHPFSPTGLGQQNPCQTQFWRMHSAKNPGKPVDFEICKKRSDTLKIFDNTRDNYEIWHDRLVDHIAQNCMMWKSILEYVETYPTKITRAETEGLDCMGVGAWELSLKLENFLVLWIDEKMYKRR